MTLARALSLSVAVSTAALSGCAGSSLPTASSPLESTGATEAQVQGHGAGAIVQAQTAPVAVFRTNPPADAFGHIAGKAPFTVTFNLCQSTDPDPEDALNYTYTFGDGEKASHRCRADHTYVQEGNFEATVCVADKRFADRSAMCQTYRVDVNGESHSPSAAVTQSGSVTLCDLGYRSESGLCGIPSDPRTSYPFDFDSLTKVPSGDPSADFSKGVAFRATDVQGEAFRAGDWYVSNGALQVNTGVPANQLATVTCGASDGRSYSAGSIAIALPNSSVICLRTALGRYVKYTGRTSSGYEITIDYVAY